MRLLHLAAIAALTACIGGQQPRNVDLSGLPRDKIALIGTVRVFNNGYEQTSRTAIEVTGDSRGLQLPPSGDVVWIVDRPRQGSNVRLTAIATLDYFQNFADGLVLGYPSLTARCTYFGTIDIRINESRNDELAQAVVGMSFPGGGAVQYDDGGVGLRRIVRNNSKLKGVTCDAVLGPPVLLQ